VTKQACTQCLEYPGATLHVMAEMRNPKSANLKKAHRVLQSIPLQCARWPQNLLMPRLTKLKWQERQKREGSRLCFPPRQGKATEVVHVPPRMMNQANCKQGHHPPSALAHFWLLKIGPLLNRYVGPSQHKGLWGRWDGWCLQQRTRWPWRWNCC
jgi:hypothetical protein